MALESGCFMRKETKKVIFLSGIIWIISNLHHPNTPSFFTSLNLPDHIFGTSYAAMVFSIFLTSPIWGSIGDKGKRKNTLILATFCYGIVQIIFSRAETVWTILLLRVFAGMAAGGFHVGLMSALVDTSSNSNRKVIMAKYSAVLSVCSATGFLIGGLLGYLSPQTVFVIQGMGMISVSLGIKLFLNETNPQQRGDASRKTKFVWDIIKEAKENSEVFNLWVILFLSITFFVGIAYSGNNNAFNYYLKKELDMLPIVNGIWKAVVGIVGLIANLSINVWIINKTNIKKSMIFILFFNSIFAYLLFLNNNTIPFFLYSFLFFTLYTIQLPILQGFAVEGDMKDVGFMAGIFNAMKSLGEMLGAVIAGFTYDINSKMPFLIAAISLTIAFSLAVFNYVKNEKGEVNA